MTRNAIIRGLAAWAEEALLPQLVPTGILSVGLKTALNIARENPALAEAVIPKFAPAAGRLLNMADAFSGDDAKFEESVKAFKSAIDASPGKVMRWQMMEVGLFNNVPHSFALNADGVDAIAEKIRAEAAKEKAGA